MYSSRSFCPCGRPRVCSRRGNQGFLPTWTAAAGAFAFCAFVSSTRSWKFSARRSWFSRFSRRSAAGSDRIRALRLAAVRQYLRLDFTAPNFSRTSALALLGRRRPPVRRADRLVAVLNRLEDRLVRRHADQSLNRRGARGAKRRLAARRHLQRVARARRGRLRRRRNADLLGDDVVLLGERDLQLDLEEPRAARRARARARGGRETPDEGRRRRRARAEPLSDVTILFRAVI